MGEPARKLGGRPRLADRKAVLEHTLPIKVSAHELELIEAERAAEEQRTGTRPPMSKYLRGLVREHLGLGADDNPPSGGVVTVSILDTSRRKPAAP